MATTTLQTVCRHLRKLAGAQDAAHSTDRHLLQRFLQSHDEAAFAGLVKRHGPMVLGVCRRVLGNAADAEDAFQAAFLVLAKRAATIRNGEALPSWLYGTAYRCALEIRRKAERRRTHEGRARPATVPCPALEAALRELQVVLDEEVQRLPEKLRAPFVLCCLEGLSKAEAARELAWKEGTVSGRLAQARERLRLRLARRGITLSAALCALALTCEATSAAVPSALTAAAVHIAGEGAGGAPQVAAVVRAVTRELVAARVKPLLALLAAGLMLAGASALDCPRQAADEPPARPAPAVNPSAPAARVPGTDLFGDPLPPGAVARLGTVRLRSGNAVRGVVFCAGGKVLASTGLDNLLRLWDATTGKPLLAQRVTPEFAQSFCLAASPDGKAVAVGGNAAAIAVFQIPSGRLLHRLQGHKGPVAAVAFSLDGMVLASGGWDNTLRLWDLTTGRELRRLEGHADHVTAVAFAPGGKLLVSGGGDKTVRVWDPATGKEVRRLAGHARPVIAVALSPDGTRLATGGGDRDIRLWDPATGKERGRLEGNGDWIRSLAFSPDGALLAAATATFHERGLKGALLLWDVRRGKALPRFSGLHEPVEAVAFAPDGKTLAAGVSHHNHVRFWDVATGKDLLPAGHHAPSAPAGVSADGRRALTHSYGETGLRLWDTASGEELRRFPGDLGLLLPDGRTVLALASAGPAVLFVYDAATGKELRRVPCPALGRWVTFTPDGRRAATVLREGGIVLWDTDTGKELHRLARPGNGFSPVAFTRDGKLLATASAGTVTLWDVASGKALRTIEAEDRQVDHVAFSPDGRLLATGCYQKGPRLWDMASGLEVRSIRRDKEPHGGDLDHPTFSSDGRTLVTTAWAGKISLWEVATGGFRDSLEGHQGVAYGFAFSRDGRLMVSGSNDTTGLAWDLTGRGRVGKAELTDAELTTLWDDLAGADAARAYQALLKLTAGAAKAVPFLRRHLKPAVRGDTAHVARLVADLGSARFATRQKAMSALEKLGEAAESPLREALTRSLTAEVQQRVRKLLDRLDAQAAAGRLRTGRALEALERAGTPEARRLLRELAAGAPGAWLTEEAHGGLRRVE